MIAFFSTSDNPDNWTPFVRSGWDEWREARLDFGPDSAQAKRALGRFMDRKVNIEQNPTVRKLLAVAALELMNS